MKFVILCLLSILTFSSGQLSASIMNTKHNLSVSNTAGTIKAQAETEVCVFCHIPHQARPVGKPLWNRSMPTSNYAMYDSDYLRRIGYPDVALDLGTANDTPGALSRQCLSCHDGTVAVGSVFKLRRTFMDGNVIAMDGVEGDGTIPSTASGFLGTDLTMHHPVGVEYNPTITKNFDIGTRTAELKIVPDSPVKLFKYGGKRYVECSSCHDPHKDNGKFLHVDTGTNHAQNVRDTCLACHDKSGGDPWPTTHQVIGMPYRDAEVLNKYGTYNPSDFFCVNCHTPHNGEGKPYLLRKVEQQTCFQGAASSPELSSCHGTGAITSAPDIESVLLRTYGHPVSTIDGVHTDLDVLYGTGVSRSPVDSKGLSWDDSKHAECMDCHNPHRLGSNVHVPDNQWYPSIPTNSVSDVLRNVTGVEPNWPEAWTQPTTFTTLESSTKEYQICLKCHSYWGLGVAADGVSGHFLMNSGTYATDQAWEFNPNNRSAHPVVMSLNSRPGSSEPKGLKSEHLLSPWNASPGHNTMYCSDCHGADNEIGGDPKGPHGSNFKYMLKGENNYWPAKVSGELYNVTDIFNGGDAGLFCKNCHDLTIPQVHQFKAGQFGGWPAMNTTCVTCHVVVPHGSSISRLLGYTNFPEPYNYQGNSLRIDGYLKNNQSNFIDTSYAYSYADECKNCHDDSSKTFEDFIPLD